MPFENEFASGESLLSLESSLLTNRAFREFQGKVRTEPPPGGNGPPTSVEIQRRNWTASKVIAFDGSTISEALRGGFPMAEASLVKVSVVRVDLPKLTRLPEDQISSPRVFYDMEQASTFDMMLQGANVIRKNVPDDSPKLYFRQAAFDAFVARLDDNHETLIETVRDIVARAARPRSNLPACPVEGCPERLLHRNGAYACPARAALGCTRQMRFGVDLLLAANSVSRPERFCEMGVVIKVSLGRHRVPAGEEIAEWISMGWDELS